MKSIYLAKGHNSWTNKTLKRVFNDYTEAHSFLEGLTDSSVKMYSSDNLIEAMNLLLREEMK